MYTKKMSTKKKPTPFTEMLSELISKSINPRTQKRYTFEALAEKCRLSYRSISQYVNGHTIPPRNTLCDLIDALRPHPVNAIKLAQLAGYDISFDTDENRYLWDKITVNWACRLKEKSWQKKQPSDT